MTAITIAQMMDPAAYNIIAMFWYIMDCTVSSTCTYLVCRVNKRYYLMLCLSIHSICERYKLKRIKKKMMVEPPQIANAQDCNSNGCDAHNVQQQDTKPVDV